jgi:mono/diheme cytochrome c family protein
MELKRRAWILLVTAGLVTAGLVLWGFSIVRRGFSARDEPSRTEAFVARKLRRMAAPADARRLRNPVPNTDTVLKEARAHFADHCATCHGNDGKGETPIGKNLYPRAPDMSGVRTQSLSDGELFYTIKNGVRLSGMPAWGKDTVEDDRVSWALVYFIRHLPSITPLELVEMRALNPKSREELEEEEAERNFLEGGEPPSHSAPAQAHRH